MPVASPSVAKSQMKQACEDMASALNEGKLGDIVAKHEQLIMHYYADVQQQAKRSFDTANSTAKIGFWVLIATLIYAFAFDGLRHFDIAGLKTLTAQDSFTVAGVGVISGLLIEFIAGVAFWLYSRSAEQFGAFHICLERTHRYLLAYKMVEQLGTNKDETLRDLVCIMANAPMISRESVDSKPVTSSGLRGPFGNR
jgi:hypothetical protein